MKTSYDVIVVGAGIVGLSTALAAAKAGLQVACVDPHGLANSQNASSDESRLFRLSYYENPAYVPLLVKAAEGWKSIEEGLLVECGGFYAGPIESELVNGSLKSAIQNGLDHDFISQSEAKQRFPQFSLPDGYWAVHEKDAGYVLSRKATIAVGKLCLDWGVSFVCETVKGISPTSTGWKVEANDSHLFGDRIILANGFQCTRLVPMLSDFLMIEPHLVHWHATDGSIDWNSSPGFGIMDEENNMLYGFPGDVGIPGVKVGGHQSVNSEHQMAMVKKFLRGLTGSICGVRGCDYDVSPDGHFMIGEIECGLTVACGFSGHGYKFGSIIGELILRATDGGLGDELQFLSVSRYLIRS